MQEPSVSSTTSSPCKFITISLEKATEDAYAKTTTNDLEQNTDKICSFPTSLSVSCASHHPRRRPHTCSKARKRQSKSSDKRYFRKSRNHRRHHRSRRSPSRSRHYSGTRRQHRRRHRHRYSVESSFISSARQSYSESRSTSRRSQHRSHASGSSQPTDLLNSRSEYESNDAHLTVLPHQPKPINHDASQVALPESPKDNATFANGIPKLTPNPALNGLVSLLLNTTNSTTSLTELFSPTIYGITGNSVNLAGPTSSNSTRQARRLYIGSIPLGITSETMMAFFSAELQNRGLCQSVGEPVVCAQVNSERHFAFIELRSVEETTAALSLDGINCLGSTLRIRRPRDYFPPGTHPLLHSATHFNANAIFLTGIPTNLSEVNLCRLLSAYGTLRTFSMLRDPVTAVSRGCGFFEYTATESAELACLGLQNHPSGGGKLFAIRADHLLVAPPSIPLPLHSSSSSATQGSPTPILCLANMVSPHDIDSDEDYADVMEDVRSECLRHGVVLSIHIPKPKSYTPLVSNVMNAGKIFVEFATVHQAEAAGLALDGRKYNGRTVVTSFYDPARYAAKEFC